MDTVHTIVIVGGGLAGANAAFTLRGLGFAGRLVLIGEEAVAPYERPPMSKEYLRGKESLDEALVRPSDDYAERQIELLLGRRAVELEANRRRVTLDDGAVIDYDALLIATGAEARRLDLPGAELAGVHYLRTVGDADAIRQSAANAGSIAVIGSGWIGSEVAASLRQLGGNVTLVSNRPRPLEGVLGAEVGEVYRTLHVEHGVNIVHGTVATIHGRDRVAAIELADGRRLAAELVVVGVGALPRTELAVSAGVQMADDGGVAVDEYLRTSDKRIYAAGDIASAWHPRYGRRLRVEHWDNAIEQGKAAAANMLGAGEPYRRTPYFYSDQFDLGMEYRGHAPEWEQVVVRGDLERREFDAFWLAGGRVVAALNANLWNDGAELLRLVETDAPVDVARLRDPSVPLARAA